jgi:hypothetical protein
VRSLKERMAGGRCSWPDWWLLLVSQLGGPNDPTALPRGLDGTWVGVRTHPTHRFGRFDASKRGQIRERSARATRAAPAGRLDSLGTSPFKGAA